MTATNAINEARQLLNVKIASCREPQVIGALAKLIFDMERGELAEATDETIAHLLHVDMDMTSGRRTSIEAANCGRWEVTLTDPEAYVHTLARHDRYCYDKGNHVMTPSDTSKDALDYDVHITVAGAFERATVASNARVLAILAVLDCLNPQDVL